MRTSESQSKTATKLERIRWLSEQDPRKRYQNLMHHFNEDSLRECFDELDGKKAVGADGTDKEMYREKLDENLQDLIARMRRMAYRPGPVRQVLIPKAGNSKEKRPLGISNFEDKIVQRMMQKILESIYEPQFLDCSYGFRRGRGCHDAIRDLRQYLYEQDVQILIDVDLANFFGSIDHKEVIEVLRERIKDTTFIRYIVRMFKAGVLANGELAMSDEGVPQGSPASPTIANIFAHYVIDAWFEEVVRKHCKGRVKLFRYADDAVICCEFAEDGSRIKTALAKRLAKYKLKLNEEKTTQVSFSRKAYQQGQKQGVFHFLGFTFYWGRTRKGKPCPKVKTEGKRMRSKLKNVGAWARQVRNRYRLAYIWKLFCAKLEGHIRYYGVSFNSACVGTFAREAIRILYKWLNRRSQKKSFDWEKFLLFIARNGRPAVKVHHSLF